MNSIQHGCNELLLAINFLAASALCRKRRGATWDVRTSHCTQTSKHQASLRHQLLHLGGARLGPPPSHSRASRLRPSALITAQTPSQNVLRGQHGSGLMLCCNDPWRATRQRRRDAKSKYPKQAKNAAPQVQHAQRVGLAEHPLEHPALARLPRRGHLNPPSLTEAPHKVSQHCFAIGATINLSQNGYAYPRMC